MAAHGGARQVARLQLSAFEFPIAIESLHEGAVGGQAAPAGRVCCSVAAGVTRLPCGGSCSRPGPCYSNEICCVCCSTPADRCQGMLQRSLALGLARVLELRSATVRLPKACLPQALRAAGPCLLFSLFQRFEGSFEQAIGYLIYFLLGTLVTGLRARQTAPRDTCTCWALH